MKSIFGWDLPPGVTSRMIEEATGGDGNCAVCQRDIDGCECPDCTVCDNVGDPDCYRKHGMKLNREQAACRAEARAHALTLQADDEREWAALVREDAVTYNNDIDAKENKV